MNYKQLFNAVFFNLLYKLKIKAMEKIKLSLSSYSDEDLDKLFKSVYNAMNIIKLNEKIENDDFQKRLEYKIYNNFYGSAFRLLNAIMNEEAKRIKSNEL